MRNPWEIASTARPTRRMMVFVDGENLACRYKAMLTKGYRARDDIAHEPDVYVWHRGFTSLGIYHEIVRATYYTCVKGDEPRLSSIRRKMKELTFGKHEASLLPNRIIPFVFKKENGRAKGVDIQLSVDVLSHVFRRNVDSILLLSGDGDYAPLLDEVRREGVLAYVSAFSDGFSPILKERADEVYELNGTAFAEFPNEATQ